jgi:predicted flap endonuclease-1-like 5' DNA nuclease
MVAALFVAMDRVVQNAPLGDWWPVAALLGLAILIYIRDREGSAFPPGPLVEPGQSSLDGYRNAVSAPAAAAPIAAKAMSQSELDHQEIVDAYGGIRDTDVRSDVMASAATVHTSEARSTRGMVQNVMDTGATGTPEEVDEIAGAPEVSMSDDHPRTAPAQTVSPPPARTPPTAATPQPVPEASAEKSDADGSEELTDTQARSDEMASAATMDSPEAQEAETGIVENVMETGATGKPEEVDEISGGPIPSLSKEKAAGAPPSAQPDDLTVIEGIGMKMAAALKAAGIDTFSRLSTTSEQDLRSAIAAAGMRFAPSIPTWPQQAGYALRGDWDGLKSYQATFKSGRKK